MEGGWAEVRSTGGHLQAYYWQTASLTVEHYCLLTFDALLLIDSAALRVMVDFVRFQ